MKAMKAIMLLLGLAMSAGFLLDVDPTPVATEWPPANAEELAPIESTTEMVLTIRQAAERHGISPRMLEAMAQVESNFDPGAVSSAGAIGVLQVVPESAGREVYRLRGLPGNPSRQSLLQVDYNADIAAEYVAWLYRYFGTDAPPAVIVAGYNAGPTRVRSCLSGERWIDCLPAETRAYITRVDAVAGGLRWHT